MNEIDQEIIKELIGYSFIDLYEMIDLTCKISVDVDFEVIKRGVNRERYSPCKIYYLALYAIQHLNENRFTPFKYRNRAIIIFEFEGSKLRVSKLPIQKKYRFTKNQYNSLNEFFEDGFYKFKLMINKELSKYTEISHDFSPTETLIDVDKKSFKIKIKMTSLPKEVRTISIDMSGENSSTNDNIIKILV